MPGNPTDVCGESRDLRVRTIIWRKYNRKNQNKKTTESDEENQEGQGLKILTPNQVLNRLAITLAQLQARNNSEKLKYEIRQLLYFL